MTTINGVEKPGFFKRTHDVLIEGSYKSYKILFFISALVILCIASLIIILRKGTTLGEFIEGVLVESVGMLFDILILGFIFHYFSNKSEKKKELEREEREKQLKIDRYLEEIDDYRGWDEKEAMFRIVGNIKRLIKLGQKRLNLNYCFLQKAKLQEANLKGAKGLSVEQLIEVKTLYRVKGLDPELEKKLNTQKPELFQQPKDYLSL